MPSPSASDFAAEFTRLLVEQGTATREMKYDPAINDEQQATINARATRLLELAQLLGQDNPGRFVNERIAAWLRMNPLPLTVGTLAEAASEATADQDVYVTIGELGNYGYQYRVMRDDLATNARPCTIQVPDSVAEHFRQQGRRQLQAELRDCLNVPRA